MPKQLSSWERKGLLKHERPETHARCRESSSSPGGGLRHGLPRSDSRRPAPSGHGKQDGWHTSPEESVHGFVPAKTMIEDESCRKSAFQGEVKYYRNQRDNLVRLRSPRNLQGRHPWDTDNRSPQTPGRQINVDENYRYQHEKSEGSNGMNTSQKCDREGPLGLADWKPVKWSRSLSLSSWTPGLNNSICLKGSSNIQSDETNAESPRETVQPLSENASAYVVSVAPSEDASSRKKRRLRWGEGLAKYEKKKVEDPNVGLSERCENYNLSVYPTNYKSCEAEMVPVCPSPGTPSSAAEKKLPLKRDVDCKSVKLGSDINGSNDSHSLPKGLPDVDCRSVKLGSDINGSNDSHSLPKGLPDGFSSNLRELDVISIANLSSSIEELLQYAALNSMSSGSEMSTAMDKLCSWKYEVFKVLEMTESEIDSLESKLKLLVSDSGGSSASSVSRILQVKDDGKQRQAMYSMDKHDGSEAGICLDVNEDMRCREITSFQFESSVLKEGTSSVEGHKSMKDVDASQSEGKERSSLLRGNCAQSTGPTIRPDDSMLGAYSAADGMLYEMILASNKESARRASQVFSNLSHIDYGREVLQNGTLCWQNDLSIREKFVRRKQFLKFKEKLVALKFQAVHQSWLEDPSNLMRALAKPGKKPEASLRITLGGCRKNRLSIKSHVSSGVPSWVSTEEIDHCPRNLLSIANKLKPNREALKMPPLILDEREKNQMRFVSTNGLVEDPQAFEKERTMVNPWTHKEKEVFLEQLATHGKNFKRIASFLDHKTTADCIEFYYKNQKSDLFQKAKKITKGTPLSKNTYLMTSRRRNHEVNSISEDLLDAAASMMAAQAQPRPFLRGCTKKCRVSKSRFGVRSPGMEQEMSGVDILAEVCTSLCPETVSDHLQEGIQDRNQQNRDSATKKPLKKSRKGKYNTLKKSRRGKYTSHWTDDEKSLFVWAVSRYGKDFTKISECVKTRSRDQCRAFFGKARKCLRLDSVLQGKTTTNGHHLENGVSVYGNVEAMQEGTAAVTEEEASQAPENRGISDCKAVNQEREGFGVVVSECGKVVPEMNLHEQVPPRLAADASPCSVFSYGSDQRNQSPVDLNEEEKPLGGVASEQEKSRGISSLRDKHQSVANISEDTGSDQSNDMWNVNNSISQNLLKDRILDSHNDCSRTQQRLPFILKSSEKGSPGGDIKLFGQVLTVSKHHKPNPSVPEDDNKIQHIINKAAIAGNSGNSAFVKFDRDNHLGLENIPTSYGFWDGNRVCSGLSSLPPPLSKYPPTMALAALTQQQQFQFHEAAAKTFCQGSSSGASVFPSQELVDSWSQDIAKIHPYGANVARSEISDPVAALKMYYTRVNHQLWGHEVVDAGHEGGDSWGYASRDSKG